MSCYSLGVLLVFCLLALTVQAESKTPAWTAPPTDASMPTTSIEKLKGFRLLAPRFVYTDSAAFRVEGGPNEKVPDEGTCRLTFARPGSQAVFDTVSFAVKREPEPKEPRRPGAKPRPRPWRGAGQASSKEWTDGEMTVAATLEFGETKIELPAQTFRVMREAFVKTHASDPELAVWLDDANANRAIWGKIPTWRNLDLILADGKGFKDRRGFLLRSYPNPQLGRRQPYTVYVPSALDLAQPAPLLILLHGSGGDHRNLIADEAAGQRFETHPMLIANAGAYQHQEFRHLALRDLLWVVEDMKAKYNVDASRIYLQGISLGGRGTLEAAALLPDTFAALSAQGVYGIQERWGDPASALAGDATAQWLATRADIRTWLTNLVTTPAEIIIGHKDENTPPAQGYLCADLIVHFGGKAIPRGFDRDHNISLPDYDWATTREWMLKQRRSPNAPGAVRLRVANLRYNRSAWVTVDALADYARIGEISARYAVTDDGKKLLLLSASNIASATLTPPGPLTHVIVNGRPYAFTQPGAIRLTQTKDGTLDLSPAPAAPAAIPAVTKRPGLSGPIWDVWSEPFVYVHDTAETAELKDELKKSAETSAEWDVSWGDRRLPVASIESLSEEQRKNSNLIIFTHDASKCALLKDLSRAEPLEPRWTPPAESAGVSIGGTPASALPVRPNDDTPRLFRVALRPSPFNENRYVLVVEYEPGRPFNLHDLGWWDAAFQADWVAGELYKRQTVLREAGVYDAQWRPSARTRHDFRSEALLGAKASGDD